eukprot:scaffold18476_cov52-Phaeocystis_antarctica.AAC.2
MRRSSAGAGLLRQQVVVERRFVQRAGVGDAAVPVGRHHVGAGLGGLQRELQTVRCVLGRGNHSLSAQCGMHGRWDEEAGGRLVSGGERRGASGRGVPELP